MSPHVPADAATAPTPVPVELVHDHGQATVEEASYRLGTMAALVSSICAVHCLATPFLVGVLPLLGLGFVAEAWFEWAMLAVAAVIVGVAQKAIRNPSINGWRTQR